MHKKTLKNKKGGFTLIEVMIVIAILGIMIGIAFLSLSPIRDRKAVETAEREVAASIRLAQNYALNGKIGPSGNSPCNYAWWTTWTIKYLIRYYYVSGGTCASAYSSSDDIAYTLKNGVTFTEHPTSSYKFFSFSVPFGSTTINDSSVTLKKGSFCADVTVANNSGTVTEGTIYNCP
jgi:prepilin-type N-terminal cleavage/methylation domain-containing protein